MSALRVLARVRGVSGPYEKPRRGCHLERGSNDPPLTKLGSRSVADKLAWQLQVLTDTSLTPLLMHVLNSKTGDGYRSQAWLAETLGVTGRSIRRACDDLEEAGRLRVTVYGVRGKANSYRALLKSEPVAPVVEASTRAVEDRVPRRTPVSSLRSPRRTVVARKEDVRVRPSLSNPNTTPLPPTGAGASRRAFLRARIRRAATQARGAGWVSSYLDRAAWCEETASIVCKLRFAADEIRAALATLPVMSGVQVTFEAARPAPGTLSPLGAGAGHPPSVIRSSDPQEAFTGRFRPIRRRISTSCSAARSSPG